MNYSFLLWLSVTMSSAVTGSSMSRASTALETKAMQAPESPSLDALSVSSVAEMSRSQMALSPAISSVSWDDDGGDLAPFGSIRQKCCQAKRTITPVRITQSTNYASGNGTNGSSASRTQTGTSTGGAARAHFAVGALGLLAICIV
ncbi:hypothetical protein METBIDRAFT_11692 [Metschnikowia bicuspidata var. bicuspidata NRRL YB-4993]|uniref:Uncharacterized protein n=1 Tax=Metschnikowia bicuspidata var. bicuspidata NRRL YB-4993 TaxID=869754 RepID=A0A1A0HAT5_9ASCO|nr:hypothetical protein METBIDRAFT_11692 [Metschnikowia bicuspidata var. bicuspidata NRRL YB-4993]OBA21126.1 hypothetical protein METBIDRAFT_11692 [Metschnikowia bicuspidata var. bicuspidata NRRL YB-4993]